MPNARKTIRLTAYHFFQMGKFLLPLCALLAAGSAAVVARIFIRQCEQRAPVSFQSILVQPAFFALFYAAYAMLFAGLLLYFFRYVNGTKSVYALRALPLGAGGVFWSILLSMLAAVLLLWVVQFLSVYAGYGVYRLAAALYQSPGGEPGMSRLGVVAALPEAQWAPPENELYLAFVRTPLLQLFYPRHPFFWLLAAAAVLLPVISGAYLTISFYGRRWGAVIPSGVAWSCMFVCLWALHRVGRWAMEDLVIAVFALLFLAMSMGYMLMVAHKLCRSSNLG